MEHTSMRDKSAATSPRFIRDMPDWLAILLIILVALAILGVSVWAV